MTRKQAPVAKGKVMSLSTLLRRLMELLSQYVVCSDAQRLALALWVVHTHSIAAADATPYLAITSAEKQSGKSRLLDLLSFLVARPWLAIEPSDAVLFRKVSKEMPTLLLDEIDAIFGPNAPHREPLRGLLNAGNRRGATVARCVGEGVNIDVKDFPVFSAKAFAGIGRLPETIADRSIRIRLRRRSKLEKLAPYRRQDAEKEAAALKRHVESWAKMHEAELRECQPVTPVELSDRAAEGWEPLLAIADLAGEEWPDGARRAAIELAARGLEQESSAQLELLSDIYAVFSRNGKTRLTTARLLKELQTMPNSQWSDWKGKPLTPHALARLLAEYEIRSHTFRVGDSVLHGYFREDFQDAFSRYVHVSAPAKGSKRNKRNAP